MHGYKELDFSQGSALPLDVSAVISVAWQEMYLPFLFTVAVRLQLRQDQVSPLSV